jgi:hypothetical protein
MVKELFDALSEDLGNEYRLVSYSLETDDGRIFYGANGTCEVKRNDS